MKNLNISKFDIGQHFKKNSGLYISFLITITISIVVAVIILISSDGYLNLIVSKNKILYGLINGTTSIKDLFWDKLINFLFPMIIVTIMGMNFYLCLLSYLLVGYQFVLLIMTSYAVIDLYGFLGTIGVITMILPINLIFFATLIFLSVICLERSKLASRFKNFLEGYDEIYFFKIIACLVIAFLLVLLVSIVYPLILKSAIFSIY